MKYLIKHMGGEGLNNDILKAYTPTVIVDVENNVNYNNADIIITFKCLTEYLNTEVKILSSPAAKKIIVDNIKYTDLDNSSTFNSVNPSFIFEDESEHVAFIYLSDYPNAPSMSTMLFYSFMSSIASMYKLECISFVFNRSYNSSDNFAHYIVIPPCKNLYINNNSTDIGEWIGTIAYFNGTTIAENVHFDKNVKKLGKLIFNYRSNIENYNLSELDRLVEIGDGFALYQRTNNKTEMKFPKQLKRIGNNAFDSWVGPGIGSIEFNEGLEEIGHRAFQSTIHSETDIKLPTTLKKIGHAAFYNCIIEPINGYLEIPASVEYIGFNAFSGPLLNVIKFNSIVPPKTIYYDESKGEEIIYDYKSDRSTNGNYSLYYIGNTSKYLVPKGTKIEYYNAIINSSQTYQDLIDYRETYINNLKETPDKTEEEIEEMINAFIKGYDYAVLGKDTGISGTRNQSGIILSKIEEYDPE